MEILVDPLGKANAYQSARPFPHAILTGVFPESILEAVLAEFPSPKGIDWIKFDNDQEKKLGSRVENKMGDATQRFLAYLNSAPVIRFLEDLTGIQGLIPDPYFEGGGLHQILPGGFLKIHADFNWHNRLKLHRRINLLIYLNKDWEEGFGGHLELWDKDMKECREKVLPTFGKVVVFNTTDYAYHGHPNPLQCPQDRTRKSIALYYYSSTRPKKEISNAHWTLFQKRRGEEWKESFSEKAVRRLLPPILVDWARAVKSGRRARTGA
ncbi:MAG TPA: 2OG-Fe(II) oxygenase [Fibrobacteria bacterium]|nr:2OG-Fe(II) oxygenase [Fibrobacteria bacterium]